MTDKVNNLTHAVEEARLHADAELDNEITIMRALINAHGESVAIGTVIAGHHNERTSNETQLLYAVALVRLAKGPA